LANKQLQPQQIYSPFNPEDHELLSCDLEALPEYYWVGDDAKIHAKTLLQQIDDADIPLIKLLDNSWFKSQSTLAEIDIVGLLLKQQRIVNEVSGRLALSFLADKTEALILREFSPGLELKRLKAYQAWIDEGRPENDKRYSAYRSMQQRIQVITESNAENRQRLKDLIATFDLPPESNKVRTKIKSKSKSKIKTKTKVKATI